MRHKLLTPKGSKQEQSFEIQFPGQIEIVIISKGNASLREMTLNIEQRNRNEALASERGQTWQRPTEKLATIINLPAIPIKRVSKHALEFHILTHDFYSLSDELISYAADSFFKFTDANGLVFEKQHTS